MSKILKTALLATVIIFISVTVYSVLKAYKNNNFVKETLTMTSSSQEKPNGNPSHKPLVRESYSTRFQDKVVLITGGTSGIGLATAVKFAAQGASHVIVCGRDKSKWEKAQNYIKTNLTEAQAKKIEYWPCDIRVESQVKGMIQKIFTQYGRLDVAFNNAGVMPGDSSVGGDITKMKFDSLAEPDGSILYKMPAPQPNSSCLGNNSCDTCDPSQKNGVSPYCESTIATSVIGTFYCLKWEIAYGYEKQPKHLPMAIINTASRNGVIPDPHRPLYAAAKAYIISLTHSLSNQVAQRSLKEGREVVRINAISPGPIDTPAERSAFPGSDANFIAKASLGVPMQRIAQPEEIATAVLFLADQEDSSYITGANIPVDGGNIASPFMGKP